MTIDRRLEGRFPSLKQLAAFIRQSTFTSLIFDNKKIDFFYFEFFFVFLKFYGQRQKFQLVYYIEPKLFIFPVIFKAQKWWITSWKCQD